MFTFPFIFMKLSEVLASVTLLADFDFSAPLASWTAGRTGFSSAFATDEWLMQDAASPMANNVGSETLANSGGLVNQSAPDIYDGTGYGNRKAWEAIATGDDLAASGTTAGDSNNEDFCFRIVFRFKSTPPSNAYLIGKRDSAASYTGWSLRATATALEMALDEGTLEVTKGVNATATHDGAWHYASGWYDYSANMIYLKTDVTAEVSASTATITASLTNGSPLKVNGISALAGAGNIQVGYAGVCVGANSQAMYDEVFWQHAQDPSGLLTTTSRNSTISVPLSATTVGHFSGGTALGTCQLPIGYNANFTDADKLGLYCNLAVTNLILYSRLSTGATSSNVTATDNAADGPDGFRAATTIAATANNGYLAKTVTTVASTAYCGSVYIEESTVGVTGRVIAYDESNGAELASQIFTATGTPQDVQVPFSTIADGISTSLRVEVDTSGETVIADLWQVNLGSARGAIINTSGAAAALVASNYRASATAGLLVKAAKGECEIVSVPHNVDTSAANQYLTDFSAAGATANRRYISSPAHATLVRTNMAAWNSAAGLEMNLFVTAEPTTPIEVTALARWDASGGLAAGGGKDGTLSFNAGTGEVSDVGSHASTETLTDVTIGSYYSNQYHFDGVIQRVRIWDQEGGA